MKKLIMSLLSIGFISATPSLAQDAGVAEGGQQEPLFGFGKQPKELNFSKINEALIFIADDLNHPDVSGEKPFFDQLSIQFDENLSNFKKDSLKLDFEATTSQTKWTQDPVMIKGSINYLAQKSGLSVQAGVDANVVFDSPVATTVKFFIKDLTPFCEKNTLAALEKYCKSLAAITPATDFKDLQKILETDFNLLLLDAEAEALKVEDELNMSANVATAEELEALEKKKKQVHLVKNYLNMVNVFTLEGESTTVSLNQNIQHKINRFVVINVNQIEALIESDKVTLNIQAGSKLNNFVYGAVRTEIIEGLQLNINKPAQLKKLADLIRPFLQKMKDKIKDPALAQANP